MFLRFCAPKFQGIYAQKCAPNRASEEKIDETTDASVEIAQQLDESGDENVKEQDDYSQEDNSGITEKEPQENNQEINHEFIQGDDVKVPAITEEESTGYESWLCLS